MNKINGLLKREEDLWTENEELESNKNLQSRREITKPI